MYPSTHSYTDSAWRCTVTVAYSTAVQLWVYPSTHSYTDSAWRCTVTVAYSTAVQLWVYPSTHSYTDSGWRCTVTVAYSTAVQLWVYPSTHSYTDSAWRCTVTVAYSTAVQGHSFGDVPLEYVRFKSNPRDQRQYRSGSPTRSILLTVAPCSLSKHLMEFMTGCWNCFPFLC